MKLPVWLLHLLPMWEYICPRCNKPVDKNSSKCVHCSEVYGSPIRVPPKMLKDPKALEDYVHEHIFPRVNKAQRDYLAQYFTELFNDHFEDDFNQWTTTSSNNGTANIVTSPIHHGSKSAEFATNSGATNSYAYARKDLASSYTTFHMRAYIRFSELPDTNSTGIQFMACGNQSGGTAFVCGLYRDGSGDLKWWAGLVNPLTDYYSSTVTPSADTWYCAELEAVVDGSSGVLQLWIDGDNLINQTGLDTDNKGNVNKLDVRIYLSGAQSSAKTTYIDCVVAADTYIGQEEESSTYTKTWATDTLFKKLGIQTSLNVDTAFQKQDNPKTFTLDATFQKKFTIQKQIDALFKRLGIPKSFAVDARFGTMMAHTIARQINVALKRLDAAKNFGVDVYFGASAAGTYARSFGLNVIFAYRVRLPELWLDENGKLVLNISKPYVWVGT